MFKKNNSYKNLFSIMSLLFLVVIFVSLTNFGIRDFLKDYKQVDSNSKFNIESLSALKSKTSTLYIKGTTEDSSKKNSSTKCETSKNDVDDNTKLGNTKTSKDNSTFTFVKSSKKIKTSKINKKKSKKNKKKVNKNNKKRNKKKVNKNNKKKKTAKKNKKKKIKYTNIRIGDVKAKVTSKGLSKKDRKKYVYVYLSWRNHGSVTPNHYVVYLSKTNGNNFYQRKVTKKNHTRLKLPKKYYKIRVRGYRKKARGKEAGFATINGKKRNATKITYNKLPKTLGLGKSIKIVANTDSKVSKKIKWSSSNSRVATVNNGKIKGINPGIAKITTKTHNGITRSFNIKVLPIYPRTIKIVGYKSSMKVGSKAYFSAKAESAIKNGITWKSSKSSVATVSKYGLVTAKKTGKVTITATAINENKKVAPIARTTVKVYKPKTVRNVSSSSNGSIENMVIWAKNIAYDDNFGYSMGTKWGAKMNRFDYFEFGPKKASKDYDCASFVSAAVAHGYKKSSIMNSYNKRAGGCRSLLYALKSAGWTDMGKLPYSKLKRGDILINPSRHTEIFLAEKDSKGRWLNVAAHNDRDGKTGDSKGTEISVAPSCYFSYYTHVLRLQ